MKTIAITGGIGSGKSTVTAYLTEMGYGVIDADKMSRDMTSPSGKAMPYILENFGSEYINADGGLDRAKMRELVFSDAKALRLLEEGTTKVVIEDIRKIQEEAEARGDELLFFDIPLLFEKHCEGDYDKVWVVTADYEIRSERVMQRDGISPEVIDLIMDSQAEEDVKISKADAVIYNNGSIEELKLEVDNLLKENLL